MAQNKTDKDEILRIRNASNEALRKFDEELDLTFQTDEVLTAVSNGTLLKNKEDLRKFVLNYSGAKMYWVRTPIDIEVNVKTGLAWESGTWKGYTINSGDKPINGGKYSAQWKKINGDWKINAQLFVGLEQK
jgi:hypothetical protein